MPSLAEKRMDVENQEYPKPNADPNLDPEADPNANPNPNSNDAPNFLATTWSLKLLLRVTEVLLSILELFLHQKRVLISWEDDGYWETGGSKP